MNLSEARIHYENAYHPDEDFLTTDQRIMNVVISYNQIVFAHVKVADRSLIDRWLKRPHIRQWLHGKGLQNTLNSLAQFLEGPSDFDHWLAFDNGKPFAYLLTSTVDQTEEALSAIPFAGSKAISLDVFIGEPEYIGKGYGTAMIKLFLKRQFPDVSDVLIDPEVTNSRAVHVYRKIGFRVIETFIAPWHPVPHYLMHLDRKSKCHA